MLVRYVVRRLSDKTYRSARSRGEFGSWEGAQTWENAKTAQKEAESYANHKRHLGWDTSVRPSVFRGYEPDPWPCEVIAVNIPEPA